MGFQQQEQTLSQNNHTVSSQIPNGLPNIGNTCFINSALQQLYKIQPLHKLLNEEKLTESRFSLLKQIRQVFSLMSMKENRKQDLKCSLKKLANILEYKLPNYKMGRQNDSYEFLLLILNEAFEYDQKIYNQFMIECTMRCSCLSQSTIIQEIKIQSQQSICIRCNCALKRIIRKYPNFLIVQGGDKQKNKEFIQKMGQKDIYYKLLSINMYTGNGHQGHYYSLCQYKNKLYKFNDSYVSDQVNYNAKMITSIYQKVAKKPQELQQILLTNIKNNKIWNFKIKYYISGLFAISRLVLIYSLLELLMKYGTQINYFNLLKQMINKFVK